MYARSMCKVIVWSAVNRIRRSTTSIQGLVAEKANKFRKKSGLWIHQENYVNQLRKITKFKTVYKDIWYIKTTC